jgi:hypothetical protein
MSRGTDEQSLRLAPRIRRTAYQGWRRCFACDMRERLIQRRMLKLSCSPVNKDSKKCRIGNAVVHSSRLSNTNFSNLPYTHCLDSTYIYEGGEVHFIDRCTRIGNVLSVGKDKIGVRARSLGSIYTGLRFGLSNT